jgi:hypothetical protein
LTQPPGRISDKHQQTINLVATNSFPSVSRWYLNGVVVIRNAISDLLSVVS